MAWLYYVLLFLFQLAGLAIVIMTLPGLWLMLAATAIYAILTHGRYLGVWTLAVLLVLAAVAEIIEFTSSGAGAKRAGGGRAGLFGALIGGLLGGIFLSFIPIPVVSTFVGVCLGTFLGAVIAEFAFGRDVADSLKIGFGAAKGRVFGTFIKFGFGCVMLLITMGVGIPIGRAKAPPATTTAPIRTIAPSTAPIAR